MWVHGDQHHTLIVVDKEAKGVPLTWITSSFKGIMCHFQVDLYVGHKVQDLFWDIEAGIDMAYYESNVDVSDLLMLVICLKDEEYGCSPTEVKGALHNGRYECTLSNELLQVVQGNVFHVANSFLLVFAVSGPFTSFLVLHTVSWFSRSEVCAFVWGIFVRGLRVETFVRVLRSSRVVL